MTSSHGGQRRRANPATIYLITGGAQGAIWAAWGLAALGWWVVDLDLSPFRLVALGAALEVAVMVSESPTGAVADVYSRKWSQVISWVLTGVASLTTPLTRDLVILLALQALWGFGYTFQSGADTAWVTDELGREDDRLIMRRAIWRLIGVIIGVAAVIALIQLANASIETVMMAAGAVSIGFGLLLAMIMPEHNFSPVDRSKRSSGQAVAETWRRGLALIGQNRILRIIIIVTVLGSMADEVIDRLDLVRLIELGAPAVDAADTSVWFGAAWIVLTLLTLPVMLFLNRADKEISDTTTARSMIILLIIGTIGILGMAGGWLVVAVAGWAMRDVVREVAEPMLEGWVNRHAESSVRATALSFRSQAMAAGEIGGGLALGAAAEIIPLWVVFTIAGLLYALAASTVTRR